MIFKAFEVQKINIDKNNIILLYGDNQGAKEDEISKLLLKNNFEISSSLAP